MRRIVEDYEAKLRPAPGRIDGSGKAEWERYANDDVVLSVRARGLAVPDRATIEVRLDGGTIGSMSADRGRARLDIESADGAVVPPARVGQVIELLSAGDPILTGVFVAD